jgi:hypothetical protein
VLLVLVCWCVGVDVGWCRCWCVDVGVCVLLVLVLVCWCVGVVGGDVGVLMLVC